MVFRADEAAQAGFDEVMNYLVPRAKDVDDLERARSRQTLVQLHRGLGSVVDAYPSWHPLVRNHGRDPVTLPSRDCGYVGLDHTRYFVNGFITCPYGGGEDVLASVQELPQHPAARISAEILDVKLYNSDATPILVRCQWVAARDGDGMIPLSIAMPLLLEKEVPCSQWAEVAETWQSMRPYLLGRPHGSRSSLFVNQETGLGIKKMWEMLIYSGMFGPIKV